MAGYFVAAVYVAVANGHYISIPFLLLFFFGFAYVGAVSAWQAGLGQAVRRLWQRAEDAVVPEPVLVTATAEATPCPVLLPVERPAPRRARGRGETDRR